MSEDKTQQYVISTIGILTGIILLIISFKVGIKNSGWIVTLFGVFFGGTGLLSFFNPTISKVLGQIMHNLVENQRKEEIRQQQFSPDKSPQAGVIHGNQYISYGTKDKEEKKLHYNREKIEKRLNEIKKETEKLSGLNHEEGNKIFSPLKTEVRGIIHKIYSKDPKGAENRLIHHVFWMINSNTKESDYQRWYEEDVEGLIDTIVIILREIDLE